MVIECICFSRNFGAGVVRRRIQMANNNHTCSLRGGKEDSRGALVVLEGLDRCGKTTQSTRLVANLEKLGHSAELWRFPDRTTSVGQMISSYLSNKSQLDDHTIHLLFSANRWEKRAMRMIRVLVYIKCVSNLMYSAVRFLRSLATIYKHETNIIDGKQIESGITLVVDRYSYSGVAFSSAKGLDIEWCKAPEIGLLAPDLVVCLDIPPEKAAERGGYGGERYEQLEFQKKVGQNYQVLRGPTWKIIDACLPMEDVEEQLQEMVLHCVKTCQEGKPLSCLWSC
ncbi:unnamed protein product [Prunus armeniaca]|uniref:dTMP kinase n=1 Tax=Prunus armeniaca TaxID=36596 RepID=A0A6J5UBZ9_PRUAR|nr:unnamed protein product [Prunus armeniaca]